MQILNVILSTNPASGGPIHAIMSIGAVWRRMGHDQEIASLDHPDDPWVRSAQVPVAALQGQAAWLPGKLGKYGFSLRFIRWMRENVGRFDAVIVHGLWNFTAIGTFAAIRSSRTPYFLFTHGMLDPWFRDAYPMKHLAKQVYWLLAERHVVANAQYVFFTTEEELILARNSFWPYRLREKIIRYGADDFDGNPAELIEAFFRHTPALRGKRFIVFLGRLHPKKGCDMLLRALAAHASQHSEVELLMAGPDQSGWQVELQCLAVRLGIAQRIHWAGMIGGAEKWGALLASEAFILPSHQENFGVAVAEALACSKPVIITDKVNIWREVQGDHAGLVSGDTFEGVERSLGTWLNMAMEARSQMARAARLSFERRFDIDNTAKQLLDIMREERCVSGAGPGHRR